MKAHVGLLGWSYKEWKGIFYPYDIKPTQWQDYYAKFFDTLRSTPAHYLEMVTAKNVYIRFHGPGKLYASLYTEKQMEECAEKCKAWTKDGHTVWAYFNNTAGGHALENAKQLKKMTEGK